MESSKGDVTVLLERIAGGDRSAEEALLPRVYLELHRIASNRLRSERRSHTLQATALVHEAYLRFCRSNDVSWKNRAQFFAFASQLMRHVLTDYARRQQAGKRDGGMRIDLADAIVIAPDKMLTALEIDDLIGKLAAFSPRAARIVEMRFFGGLSEEDMALVLGIGTRQIRRDWLMARAWLHEQMSRG